MKMRSLIFGLAVFVCSALIFSGCEQEADDDGGGDTFTDITAKKLYPKTDSSDISGYSNSLTIDSVILNNSTGVVTITLSGTIVDVRATETEANGKVTGTSSDTFWQGSYPYDGQFTPEAGKYGAFVFDNAFPPNASKRILAIKSTNDAFRYYTDATYNATNGPLTKPATEVQGNIYIPESGAASRWRLYSAGAIPDNDWLSVLLWSGADPKRIDLEIQEFEEFYADSTDYIVLSKFVIDYSKVEFQTPAEALAEKLEAAESGTTVTLADNVTIAANETVTVPAGVTLDVGSKTLTFEDEDSSLILLAGASLKAGASGKFVANSSASPSSSAGITLTVGTAAAPETATGFTSATVDSVITLTTATTAGTATATDYIIGDAKFAITSTSATAANAVTSTALGTDTAAASTIKAGEGTAITFAGKS